MLANIDGVSRVSMLQKFQLKQELRLKSKPNYGFKQARGGECTRRATGRTPFPNGDKKKPNQSGSPTGAPVDALKITPDEAQKFNTPKRQLKAENKNKNKVKKSLNKLRNATTNSRQDTKTQHRGTKGNKKGKKLQQDGLKNEENSNKAIESNRCVTRNSKDQTSDCQKDSQSVKPMFQLSKNTTMLENASQVKQGNESAAYSKIQENAWRRLKALHNFPEVDKDQITNIIDQELIGQNAQFNHFRKILKKSLQDQRTQDKKKKLKAEKKANMEAEAQLQDEIDDKLQNQIQSKHRRFTNTNKQMAEELDLANMKISALEGQVELLEQQLAYERDFIQFQKNKYNEHATSTHYDWNALLEQYLSTMSGLTGEKKVSPRQSWLTPWVKYLSDRPGQLPTSSLVRDYILNHSNYKRSSILRVPKDIVKFVNSYLRSKIEVPVIAKNKKTKEKNPITKQHRDELMSTLKQELSEYNYDDASWDCIRVHAKNIAMYFILVTGCRPTEANYFICNQQNFQTTDMEVLGFEEGTVSHKCWMPGHATKTSKEYAWYFEHTDGNTIESALKALGAKARQEVQTSFVQLGYQAISHWFKIRTKKIVGKEWNARSIRCYVATQWLQDVAECDIMGTQQKPNPLCHTDTNTTKQKYADPESWQPQKAYERLQSRGFSKRNGEWQRSSTAINKEQQIPQTQSK